MNNIFIHDQLSFMATINTSSVWSTLIIAMNRWEFMHVWMIIVHICMNSHLFIAMINVDQADDMLIVAMKDCWSFMITYIIMSSWNISWPLSPSGLVQTKYGGVWGVSGYCLRMSGSVRMVSECVRQMSCCKIYWKSSITVIYISTYGHFFQCPFSQKTSKNGTTKNTDFTT